MKKILLIFIFLLAFEVFLFPEAYASGAYSRNGIPTFVWYQFINFSIFAGILIYALKDKLPVIFEERVRSYQSAVEKAKKMEAEVQAKSHDLKTKIDSTRRNQEASLKQAREEVLIQKEQILTEARNQAFQLRTETKTILETEWNSLRQALSEQLLEESLSAARDKMKKDVDATAQARLQKEFLDKIQVVP